MVGGKSDGRLKLKAVALSFLFFSTFPISCVRSPSSFCSPIYFHHSILLPDLMGQQCKACHVLISSYSCTLSNFLLLTQGKIKSSFNTPLNGWLWILHFISWQWPEDQDNMRGALPPLTHNYPDYSHADLLMLSINLSTTVEMFDFTVCHLVFLFFANVFTWNVCLLDWCLWL